MNDYQEILEFISEEIGLNIDSIGLLSIARAINNSMRDSGFDDIFKYSNSIKINNQLFSSLIEGIKVPETWFFRDVECFNYMKSIILNDTSKYSSNYPLRILSAPCSTGEEPYSAVILAYECGINPESLEIIATDISHNSVDFAKKGVYRKGSFRNDYYGFWEKHFNKEENTYRISEKIKSKPEFVIDNFTKSTFLNNHDKFDFIFCKNLLIYLNDEARKEVLSNINRLLKDDGVLLVGLSEINYFSRNGFEQVRHNMAFACKKNSNSHITPFPDIQLKAPNKIEPKQQNEISKVIEKKSNFFSIIQEPIVSKEVYTIENVKQFADKGDFEGAEKICSVLLKHDFSNTEALYFMGLIQNALKNTESANDYFKKVLYMKPDHYESLIHLSLTYESTGENERARLFRERAERVFLKNTNIDRSNS